jgi:hypothetical protein
MWMTRLPIRAASIHADFMDDSSSHGRHCQHRGTYDVVINFDVFEHLPDRREAARRLIGCLHDGGVVVQTGGFHDEGHHPCHLEGASIASVAEVGHPPDRLGLRGDGSNILVKVRAPIRRAQQARLWI